MRLLKPSSLAEHFRLEDRHRKQRNQPDHRADLQKMLRAIGQMQRVVVETVFLVPQRDALRCRVVHGLRDVDEMLEKFAGHVFVGRILARKFQRDGQHVQAVHAHPAGAVGLLEMAAGRQRRRAVEDADIVEAEEAALRKRSCRRDPCD